MTPWTVACRGPLSIEFPRQEYWSKFSSPGDLPDPRIEPRSPALQAVSLSSRPAESLKASCVPAKSLQSRRSLRPYGLYPGKLLCPWDSPGKNTVVGCHALLQGNLPDPRIKPTFLCLSHWQAGPLPLVPLGKLQVATSLAN